MCVFGFSFAAVLFLCCKLGFVAAYAALGASVVALIIYIVAKRLRSVFELPLAAGAVLLSAVLFLLFWRFSYMPAARFDGATAFTGKVVSLPYTYDNGYGYEIKTFSIGEEFTKQKLLYYTEEPLECTYFDCISVNDAAVFVPKNEKGDISESFLARKIYLAAYAQDTPQVLFSCSKTPFWYILKLRENIIETAQSYLSGDRAGVVIAMVMGDTGYISAKTAAAFNNSGAAHLLAVSGFNVSLWTAFIIAFLTVFGLGGRLANTLSMGFLVFFSALTGFSPSILRASAMLAVILCAPFFKRRGDALNSLGLAVCAITCVNPFAVLSIGFQLSVTATLGIVSLGQALMSGFAAKTASLRFVPIKRFVRYTGDIVIITLTAFIFTLPVMVEAFGRVSLIAPVTNLAVMSLASLITVFGGTGVLLSYVSLLKPVANLWFALCNLFSGLVLDCVNKLGSLRYAALPVDETVWAFWFVSTLLLMLAAWVIWIRRKTRLPLAAVSILCLLFFVAGNIGALLPSYKNIRVHVLKAAGTPVIVLQSGSHYALIACPRDSAGFERAVAGSVPALPTTDLDLLLVIPGSFCAESYKTLVETYAPKTVFTAAAVYRENTALFGTTVEVCPTARYFLWNEINLYYNDTDAAKCVIIDSGGRRYLVSLSAENDMKVMTASFGTFDALICSGGLPLNLQHCVPKRIVITGGFSKSGTKYYTKALYLTENVWYTAIDGTCELIEKGASRWDASTKTN